MPRVEDLHRGCRSCPETWHSSGVAHQSQSYSVILRLEIDLDDAVPFQALHLVLLSTAAAVQVLAVRGRWWLDGGIARSLTIPVMIARR